MTNLLRICLILTFCFLSSMIINRQAGEIAKLHMLVLIAQGTNDIQISVQDADLFKHVNTTAKLVVIGGMNHIFKDVEIDRFKNLATYSNPDLPLNSILISSIVEFIKK